MNFLFSTGLYKPAIVSSGPVFSVSGLAEALVKQGHNVTVLACYFPGAYPQSIEPGSSHNINGVSVVYFQPQPYFWQRLPIKRLRNMSVFSLGRSFENWLDENLEQFDVADSQLGFLGSNGLLSKKAVGLGIVYFYHQRGNLDPTHFGVNAWFKKLYITLLESRCLKNADFLIALSDREKCTYGKWAPSKPVRVIPNGVAIEELRRHSVPSDLLVDVTNAPSDLPVLLWFSRYNPMKGPDFFIDLVAGLKQRGICFKAVMAGTDENGLFLKCKRRAENEQLNDVLSVLPALRGEDRRYILQRSNIFILPTHGEGFSMAILEAMACKAVVVTTKDANFPDMVEAGAGYELGKDDINGFIDTVEELVKDPEKRIKITERAIDLISKRYGWDLICDKYECLARKAMSRKEFTP